MVLLRISFVQDRKRTFELALGEVGKPKAVVKSKVVALLDLAMAAGKAEGHGHVLWKSKAEEREEEEAHHRLEATKELAHHLLQTLKEEVVGVSTGASDGP